MTRHTTNIKTCTHTESVTEKFEYQSTTVNQSINQMHQTMMPTNEVDRDVEMGSGRDEVSNEIFHYFPLCQMPLKMLFLVIAVVVCVDVRIRVVVATCDTFLF